MHAQKTDRTTNTPTDREQRLAAIRALGIARGQAETSPLPEGVLRQVAAIQRVRRGRRGHDLAA